VLAYRIFADAQGKMNLSLKGGAGELLAVPQFTLAADTNAACASFSSAAAPADGEMLFIKFTEKAAETLMSRAGVRRRHEVSLVNDGPVTFWLQ